MCVINNGMVMVSLTNAQATLNQYIEINLSQATGIVVGAIASQRIFSKGFLSQISGVVMGCGSAYLLQDNWKLAGIGISIGMAAAGYSDILRGKLRGFTKVFTGAVLGAGAKAIAQDANFGEMKVKEMGAAATAIAVVGLAQSLFLGPLMKGLAACTFHILCGSKESGQPASSSSKYT
jgi:hypothetical protein